MGAGDQPAIWRPGRCTARPAAQRGRDRCGPEIGAGPGHPEPGRGLVVPTRRNLIGGRVVSGWMLDSPGFTSASIAVRRDPPTVEDLRSTTVTDDPVQRRDLILIERARAGDLDAFNDLVVLYQDQLFALVVRMVPDRDQASDAVQEAFSSAFRNLAGFRGGSVKSWLNRICVNAAMDTQRAKKRRPVQPYPELEDESWQPPAGEEADPERTAVHTERSQAIAAALAQITNDQRTAIVLYDVEGYDYGEIAEMTGVSLGTVKSRIHRGRLALRGLMEDRMELFRG
jgi:RNA polymerase sigma-70 factor, ECF subfamily